MTPSITIEVAQDPLSPEERRFIEEYRARELRTKALKAIARKVPSCGVLIVDEGVPVKLVAPPV